MEGNVNKPTHWHKNLLLLPSKFISDESVNLSLTCDMLLWNAKKKKKACFVIITTRESVSDSLTLKGSD